MEIDRQLIQFFSAKIPQIAYIWMEIYEPSPWLVFMEIHFLELLRPKQHSSMKQYNRENKFIRIYEYVLTKFYFFSQWINYGHNFHSTSS